MSIDPSLNVRDVILQKYVEFVGETKTRRPFLVALCGTPGSGKSTVANDIVESSASPKISILPLDGYHIPKSQLHPQRVYYRGAIDTFDLDKFKQDMSKLRDTVTPSVLGFPGFDHAIGDPVENQHSVSIGDVDIIIVEGLYVLTDHIKEMFDFRVFIDSDVDKCIDGLKERNLVIPGYSPEEIIQRCDIVDRMNALFVKSLARNADIAVAGFNA